MASLYGDYRSNARHAAASYDDVTGLLGRDFYLKRLSNVLSKMTDTSRPVAVLLIEIDKFRHLTETFGHSAGDRFLVEIAERILCCVSPTDTVARLAGASFLVLLDGSLYPQNPTHLADIVAHRVNEPFRVGQNDLITSCHIGIVEVTADYASAADILSDAEVAANEARADNRCTYKVFKKTMRDRAIARIRKESELQRAVKQGEFEPFFQPIIDLRSGLINGFEALARWRLPDGSIIQPAEFIPAAEELGLITAIDHQILRRSFKALARWSQNHRLPTPLSLSVNLSSRDLHEATTVDTVRQCLNDYAIDPQRLRLEITESILIENPELAQYVLEDIKAIGVRIALDDFGTGYSSLSYLNRFPIDCLKIDRSFVTNLHLPGKNEKIVDAIIALAKSLDLDVVAEGVESVAQLEILRRLQCDYAQGFLLARPVDESQAGRWLLREASSSSGPAGVPTLGGIHPPSDEDALTE
ncbi:MAG: GGDEF domain-containing phosphodiesterase [Myxococcota bacterium]